MNGPTKLALLVTLVGYPALRAAEIDAHLSGGPADWWRFWGAALVGHWACFGVVAFALRRSGRDWSSIGLDVGWFRRHRTRLLLALAALIAAIVAVSLGTTSPTRTGLFPLQATDLPERLFMIVGAVITAGVVEETVYRGFAITRLGELLGGAWRALPLSMISFFFIHGVPSDPARIASLLAFAFVFGAIFIRMRCRRLELLVLAHGVLNLPLLFMP